MVVERFVQKVKDRIKLANKGRKDINTNLWEFHRFAERFPSPVKIDGVLIPDGGTIDPVEKGLRVKYERGRLKKMIAKTEKLSSEERRKMREEAINAADGHYVMELIEEGLRISIAFDERAHSFLKSRAGRSGAFFEYQENKYTDTENTSFDGARFSFIFANLRVVPTDPQAIHLYTRQPGERYKSATISGVSFAIKPATTPGLSTQK